jgi:hypothetical protein
MRSMFAIFTNSGRANYGIGRPRVTFAGRFGIVVIAMAVGGMGVGNVYSQMVANAESDSVPNTAPAVVTDGDDASTDSSNTKPPPQTIGLSPNGMYDLPTLVNPQPIAGFASNSSIAPGEHAQTAAQAAPIDRVPVKLNERTPIAKKKSAAAVQVYALADGRQVTLRRPASINSKHADTAGFDPWGLRDLPWSGDRVHLARPGSFGAPF